MKYKGENVPQKQQYSLVVLLDDSLDEIRRVGVSVLFTFYKNLNAANGNYLGDAHLIGGVGRGLWLAEINMLKRNNLSSFQKNIQSLHTYTIYYRHGVV